MVISSRRSSLHKFVIKEIARRAPPGSGPSVETSPTSPPLPAQNDAAHSVKLAAPKLGGWLARIAGRKVGADSTPPGAAPTSTQDPADSAFPVIAHDAGEYNWSGFSCPYCRATGFVSCGGGHLVCDGATELRTGRRFHQCFCGHAGYIEGSIKTCSAHHHVVEAEVGNAKPHSPTSTEVGDNLATTALPLPKKRNP
jgi:hypothetical protein